MAAVTAVAAMHGKEMTVVEETRTNERTDFIKDRLLRFYALQITNYAASPRVFFFFLNSVHRNVFGLSLTEKIALVCVENDGRYEK